MKNKTGLIIGGGLTLALVIAYLLFAKNKQKSKTINISPEEVDKLANEFTNEFIDLAQKELTKLESNNVGTKTAQPASSDMKDILSASNTNHLINIAKVQKEERIQVLKNVLANKANIFVGFKKSIPKFDSLENLKNAKNTLIKTIVLDDTMANLTTEEQVFLINIDSFPAIKENKQTMGFDMPFFLSKNPKQAYKQN
jgi:hypothetical protein